jgi:hypothetical protein
MAPDTGQCNGENSNRFRSSGDILQGGSQRHSEATAGADGDVRRFLAVEAKLAAAKNYRDQPQNNRQREPPATQRKMPSFHVQ